jgi:3-hydroxy-9,10-secoandrosta-1,3,5(10)-triene-9,17-dione monooxygenase
MATAAVESFMGNADSARTVEKFDVAEFRRRLTGAVPSVRERAPAAEELRRLLPETFADLRDQRLFRVAQPTMFGGVGLDIDQVYEIAFELGRADPSTGWNAAFYALHNHQIGMMPKETQEEYWAESYDVQMATASGVVRAAFEDKGDSVLVNGEWDFASGVDYADWLQISRLTENGAMQLLLHKSQFEIIDNWHTAGARATGSNRVRVTDAVVPPSRQLDAQLMANGKTVGRELHSSIYYKLPIFPWMGYVIATAIMGAAQGMVDLFAETAVRRFEMTTSDKFVDRAANQLRIAEASAEVNAARQIHAADVRMFHEWAASDTPPTMLERAAARRNAAYCVKLCLNAAYRLFELGGATSIYNHSPLQRYYRDISVMAHSIAVVWDPIAEQYSRVLWNLPPKSYNL